MFMEEALTLEASWKDHGRRFADFMYLSLSRSGATHADRMIRIGAARSAMAKGLREVAEAAGVPPAAAEILDRAVTSAFDSRIAELREASAEAVV